MEQDDLDVDAVDWMDAIEEIARGLSSYDELEYAGAINDSVEEIVEAEATGPWPLVWVVLRAWPPEPLAQLLEAVANDTALCAVLARIDEADAPPELVELAATPEGLLERIASALAD